MQPISLVINTKNEEDNIQGCIRHLKDFVEEVIVVDMHSTDKTREIAKKSGAKVFLHQDVGYVEPARNFAISKSTNPWVLILDADEILSEELINRLPELISNNQKIVAYAVPRKNVFMNQWLQGKDHWPDYQIRIFQKSKVTWSKTIHKQPEVRGKTKFLTVKEANAIHHDITFKLGSILQRTEKYSVQDRTFENILKTSSFEPNLIRHYIHHGFYHRFITQEGNKDGMAGFILSKLMEIYRFSEVSNYWLKNGNKLSDFDQKMLNQIYTLDAKYHQSYTYKIWLRYQLFLEKIKIMLRLKTEL